MIETWFVRSLFSYDCNGGQSEFQLVREADHDCVITGGDQTMGNGRSKISVKLRSA
jgi:hypothetical protein